jgi:hypothetical protein
MDRPGAATVSPTTRSCSMAGWGDDPTLDEARTLIYEQGWTPVRIEETREADTVVVEKDGEQRELTSDHIGFHRFVEGLKEDFHL